jgi:hypothetical protein
MAARRSAPRVAPPDPAPAPDPPAARELRRLAAAHKAAAARLAAADLAVRRAAGGARADQGPPAGAPRRGGRLVGAGPRGAHRCGRARAARARQAGACSSDAVALARCAAALCRRPPFPPAPLPSALRAARELEEEADAAALPLAAQARALEASLDRLEAALARGSRGGGGGNFGTSGLQAAVEAFSHASRSLAAAADAGAAAVGAAGGGPGGGEGRQPRAGASAAVAWFTSLRVAPKAQRRRDSGETRGASPPPTAGAITLRHAGAHGAAAAGPAPLECCRGGGCGISAGAACGRKLRSPVVGVSRPASSGPPWPAKEASNCGGSNSDGASDGGSTGAGSWLLSSSAARRREGNGRARGAACSDERALELAEAYGRLRRVSAGARRAPDAGSSPVRRSPARAVAAPAGVRASSGAPHSHCD